MLMSALSVGVSGFVRSPALPLSLLVDDLAGRKPIVAAVLLSEGGVCAARPAI
jgi:hypothetical protein